MKHIYARFFTTGGLIILMQLFFHHTALAQCPFGVTPGSTMYDTTINTPPGINTLQVKFPQADPMVGMVTCLRLCISITGVVDSVSVENNSASAQTADVYYIRTDQITGPGLSAPLSNSINHHYGPYSLGPTNGVLGSGPDFIAISRDTLLNAVTVCQTINNMDSLLQFYGHDSVTYTYNIMAFTNVTCTGGNYNSTVATSAIVRFHFEYCTCPGYILPLQLRNFEVNKIADNKAKLSWSGFNDPEASYYYETQVSRDGTSFSATGRVEKDAAINDSYQFIYTTPQNENGVFFFRIKQVYANGYTRFSDVRQLSLKSSTVPTFIISPNPSNGIVGIKFDNYGGGKMRLEIYNTQGQKVMQREIVVAGNFYQQVATLQSGVYWIRLTDVTSQLTSVNQLLIK
ncbi:MAG: T9SS type A sorting domain-containing protein [Chitinophagaceae bacterium]|nr:T9SS type A sorting domain-containing protein [Chitinophagaceae bacterium]